LINPQVFTRFLFSFQPAFFDLVAFLCVRSYLRFRKQSMSSFWQTYSNPTDSSFLISSLSLIAVTLYTSSLLNPNRV